MLLKGTLMGASLCGVLSVYKAMVFLPILIGMGKGNLNIFCFNMHNGIQPLNRHRIGKQILQTVAAPYAATIIHDGQARIQIGIVAEHGLHDVGMKLVIEK